MDPDQAAREALAKDLGLLGYSITLSPSVDEGLRQVGGALPDVIILDASLPRLDMATLVQRLRSRPESALLPVLFLGQREALEGQLRGFKLASDDFIPKPVSADELDLRIAAALKIRATTEASLAPLRPGAKGSAEFSLPGHAVTFRGSLDQLGLGTLLTLFDMERKTGMLVLILEPEMEKARLHFLNGRVLQAAIDGRAEPRGAELIYHILSKTKGKFDFRPVPVICPDEIKTPSATLLLEAARRFDERLRNAGAVGR